MLAPEHRALALALLLLGGVWLFGAVAWAALHGDSRSFDEAVLRALRDPRAPSHLRGPAWLADAARDVTALGSHTVVSLGLAVAAGFLLLLRKRGMAVTVLAAGLGGMALNGALKHLFGRPRPRVVPWLVQVGSDSFPSGHALLSAAVYLSIAVVFARLLTDRRARLYLVALAAVLVALVGCTRVLLGVHYPTDVVAGWVVGGLWALLCGVVARALQHRGAVEQPGVEPEQVEPDEVSDPEVSDPEVGDPEVSARAAGPPPPAARGRAAARR